MLLSPRVSVRSTLLLASAVTLFVVVWGFMNRQSDIVYDARARMASLLQPGERTSLPMGLPASTGEYWEGWGSIEFMFFFGDSYSYTGFDPTGMPPTVTNPFGNPDFPPKSRRGEPVLSLNWVHHLVTKHNSTFIYAFSFANLGATIDANMHPPPVPGASSFIDQTHLWNNFFARPVPWQPSSALFAVWIGLNDVQVAYAKGERMLFAPEAMMYRHMLNTMYLSGARNFLLLNTPPIHRSPDPLKKGSKYKESEAVTITEWNSFVVQLRKDFLTQFPDATVFHFNTYKMINNLLDNPKITPQTAKIRNTTDLCHDYVSGTPEEDTFTPACHLPINQYFWSSFGHITSTVHDAIAARVVEDCFGLRGRIGYCT